MHDLREFVRPLPLVELRKQGARCMECGVPFCHHGCPLGNLIPDWNDLVYRDRWREAIDQLHRTNNFPEFTGRLCPAPCEAACVLEIREGDAVTIKQIELVDRRPRLGGGLDRAAAAGRAHGAHGRRRSARARPASPARSSSNRAGHSVTVFERDEAGGGLVRFGVPEFKIEKRVVERRLEQLVAEGVEFRFGVDVGVDVAATSSSDVRRGRGRHRLARAARPAGAGPRARRRPLRDGVPLRRATATSPARAPSRRSPRPAST